VKRRPKWRRREEFFFVALLTLIAVMPLVAITSPMREYFARPVVETRLKSTRVIGNLRVKSRPRIIFNLPSTRKNSRSRYNSRKPVEDDTAKMLIRFTPRKSK
jgi:hypothetical protein